MKHKKHSSSALILWHGRLCLLTGFFVLLLVFTGVFINHADDLKLDRKPVRNSALLALYGIKPPPLKAVQVEQQWLVWQGKELFLDGEQLLECKGKFVGAITLPNYWVAACENDLLVFTYEQELVERVNSAAGVTYPITQIGACEALLCYQAGKIIYQMDIETLVIHKFSGGEGHALQWSSPSAPPEKVAAQVRKHFRGDVVPTWGRVLRDVHGGHFFGSVGRYFLDAVALLLAALVISGICLWYKFR